MQINNDDRCNRCGHAECDGDCSTCRICCRHKKGKAAFVQNVELTSIPSGLVRLEELEGKTPLSTARIKELTESGYMPCWFIDGGEPLYKIADVKKYIAKHMVQEQFAIPFPRAAEVLVERPTLDQLPKCLFAMANVLLTMPLSVSGIYFLISGEEVVYVGQSTNVAARAPSHYFDKVFDRIVYLPVPVSELTPIENAFIHLLRPKYNSSQNGKQASVNEEDVDTLRKLGVAAEAANP